jgi:hypothetical protein
MKKLLLLVAGGVGYVLGTKAGRERYEQIRGMFNKVKDDPRVQEKTQQAANLAKEKAPIVKEKVTQAADTASAKVKPTSGSSSEPTDQLNPESTIFQDSPGPKGNLP